MILGNCCYAAFVIYTKVNLMLLIIEVFPRGPIKISDGKSKIRIEYLLPYL